MSQYVPLRLEAKPFRRWLRRLVVLHSASEVARRIGVDEAAVRRWTDGTYEHVQVSTVETCMVAIDGEDSIWTLYPDYDPGLPPKQKGGKPRGKYRRMTDQQIVAAYRLHLVGGLSIRELGRRLYKRYGYANEKSCANALSEYFRMAALPARDRVEATVLATTIHGLSRRDHKDPEHRKKLRRATGEIADRPRCAAKRVQYPRKGEPCGNRALLDSEFCFAHDPRRGAQRQAILEDARSRL